MLFVVFQLQQRKIEKDLCFLDLRTKIRGLWERLQIPPEEREAFSDHMVVSKKRNMEAVRKLCSLAAAERFYSLPSAPPAANRASASGGAENEQHKEFHRGHPD